MAALPPSWNSLLPWFPCPHSPDPPPCLLLLDCSPLFLHLPAKCWCFLGLHLDSSYYLTSLLCLKSSTNSFNWQTHTSDLKTYTHSPDHSCELSTPWLRLPPSISIWVSWAPQTQHGKNHTKHLAYHICSSSFWIDNESICWVLNQSEFSRGTEP